MTTSAQTLTRHSLYELVWSKPMTELAKQFGISDVGLRKICVKMNIPLPGAGHWTRVKFGQKVKQANLPKDETVKQEVTISPTSEYVKEIYGQLSAKDQLQLRIEEEMPELLIVADRLTMADKLVNQTKEYLARPYHLYDGKKEPDVLNINVSKEVQPRALRIMDTLVKALRSRGHSFVFRNRDSYVRIGEEDIRIYLREKEKRVSNENSRHSYDQYIFKPTGILCFQMGPSYQHSEITEGKIPMEKQISKIIAALEMLGEQERLATIQRNEWHAKYEKQKEAERQLKEQKEQEEKRLTSLLEQVDRFHKASLIREYVNKIEEKTLESGSVSETLINWISWARQKADEMDPLQTVSGRF